MLSSVDFLTMEASKTKDWSLVLRGQGDTGEASQTYPQSRVCRRQKRYTIRGINLRSKKMLRHEYQALQFLNIPKMKIGQQDEKTASNG